MKRRNSDGPSCRRTTSWQGVVSDEAVLAGATPTPMVCIMHEVADQCQRCRLFFRADPWHGHLAREPQDHGLEGHATWQAQGRTSSTRGDCVRQVDEYSRRTRCLAAG